MGKAVITVRKPWQAGLSILMVLMMAAGAGCAKKKAASPDALGQAEKQAKAEQAQREAWMTQGKYETGKTDWQNKIIKAIEESDTLPVYQTGIYSDDHTNSLEFDGEVNRGDAYFRFNRNHQEYPWEFIILKDRLYTQEPNGFQDNGPNSRSQGEQLFQPLLKEIRFALMQAVRGEIKDLGMSKFEEIPVHRYDLRTQVAGNSPEILTVTVDIDETMGILVHAIVGNGSGSGNSEKRFTKMYRELLYTRIGKVNPPELPDGVPVLPFVEDIDKKQIGLP
jgi:hypothetical protein